MTKIVWFITFFVASIVFILQEQPSITYKPLPKQEANKEEKEPVWLYYPPTRQVSNLGKVLSDIESHVPAGHGYQDNDRITWAHETTHKINSDIRNKFSYDRVNGFYCLNDKAIIIREPNTTITDVAKLIPNSLKGMSYKTYMIDEAFYWNNTPLYIFDEWIAYTNGTATKIDLKITNRTETVQQMLEFNVYALCVAMSCKTEDKQFKRFLKWNIMRTMDLYKQNKQMFIGEEYLNKIKTSPDATNFRIFIKDYLGKDFIKKAFDF